MKTPSIAIVVALAGTIAACQPTSQTYQPLVDQGVGPAGRNYNQDTVECRNIATQVRGEGEQALRTGLIGALIGAAGGAAIGAATGSAGTGAAIGAAAGGIGGAAYGGVDSGNTQAEVIRRCMRGRGWNVLN